MRSAQWAKLRLVERQIDAATERGVSLLRGTKIPRPVGGWQQGVDGRDTWPEQMGLGQFIFALRQALAVCGTEN